MHALVVWNCNPLVIVPNAELIREGLERDDLFTVVHEQFLTDTARYADIVLPATTQIETDDVVLPWGHLWVGWNGAAIAPVGESISQHRPVPSPRRRRWATPNRRCSRRRDPARATRCRPSTSTNCESTGWVRAPYPEDGRPFGDGEFDTPSGRVEFVSEVLERMGQPRVADVRRPPRGTGAAIRSCSPASPCSC